jgi:tetratricopeptide (TPR) repeat protein
MTGRVAFALALFGCWAAAAETARPHDNTAAFQNIRSLIDKGQYAQAETAARELVAQVESAAGPDSLETGESLDLLVEALWQGGKGTQPESRELAERAVAIKEESPGTTELSLALSLFHLAAFRSAAGEYAEAKPIFERVLQVRQTQLGPNHPDVAFTLNVFGASRRDAGDLAEARRLIEQGLAIREQTLGPEHLLVAGSLNNLASVLFSVHDYAAIGPLLERAIAIWEKALGPDHPRVGLGVSNLAALHAAQRDFAGARPLFERGLAIQEKTLGPEHPSVALTLSNLAKAMEETGDLAAARPLVERSLAIREKVFGSEHPEVAKSLAELATLLTDLGDYAAAGPLFQRALDIGEKVAGPRHPILVEPLFNMAVLLARTGKTNEAAATAFRADDIAREHGRLISRTLAEREALAYSSGRTPTLTLVLTLIAERRDQAAQFDRAAWDAVVRSRSIVLDEMAARHRSISGIEDPEIDRLAKGLTSARELLAKLLVRGPGDEPAGQYRDLLDQARQDEEKAERTLAEKNAAFRAEQARDKLGFDDVAWALPRGAALVAFATYGRVPIEKGQLSAPPQEPIPYYLAFVLNSTTEKIASVPLGTVAEIDGLVANVRRQIEQEARYVSLGRAAARNEAAYRTAGAALRARIWEPLQPHVAGAQRVFVVPDGALNFVSFSALPVGRDQYLIETGTVVHYLSAERDLIPRDAGQRGGGLLAVGAPAFDDQSLFATLAPPKPPKLAESRLAARGPATPTYRGQRSACGSFEAMSFEALPAALYAFDLRPGSDPRCGSSSGPHPGLDRRRCQRSGGQGGGAWPPDTPPRDSRVLPRGSMHIGLRPCHGARGAAARPRR